MKELNDYRKFMSKEELHKALNSLAGILDGSASDGMISIAEREEIANWYELHRHLINTHPFTEVFPLLDTALGDCVLSAEEAKDILWLCDQYLTEKHSELYFNSVTCEIQHLQGMLHGMIADGQLTECEICVLNEWLNEHDHLSGTYPFDEIYGLLLAAKEDGKISDDEQNMLKAFFATFVDTKNSYNIHEVDVKQLQKQYSIGGICAVCPNMDFEGKTFCFTGTSNRATRIEIAAIIQEHGGLYNDRVTQTTDYLIVGANGNPCWAFSCYGRKVEKAMSLRREGHNIALVHENDFWDYI